ncbi:MAG: hypothetical protein ACRDNG_02735, partial [Gaiellaceae bacterium]
LVLAFAVLAVAVGAAMAVPQARTAILEFFRLRGATVERVETLPRVPPASENALDLGRPLPEARTDVKIPEVLIPAALGPPDATYTAEEPYGMRLTLVYEPGEGVPESPYTGVGILVSEFVGEGAGRYVEKLVAGGTRVERMRVGPYPALWLEGGPHVVFFENDGRVFDDRGRLAGNTLLVERNDVLVRIEGEIDRERALEIAESLEP